MEEEPSLSLAPPELVCGGDTGDAAGDAAVDEAELDGALRRLLRVLDEPGFDAAGAARPRRSPPTLPPALPPEDELVALAAREVLALMRRASALAAADILRMPADTLRWLRARVAAAPHPAAAARDCAHLLCAAHAWDLAEIWEPRPDMFPALPTSSPPPPPKDSTIGADTPDSPAVPPDATPMCLRHTAIARNGVRDEDAALVSFCSDVQCMWLGRGAGEPGRVWKSWRPDWLDEQECKALTKERGVCDLSFGACLSLPVYRTQGDPGSGVLYILAFYSLQPRRFDSGAYNAARSLSRILSSVLATNEETAFS